MASVWWLLVACTSDPAPPSPPALPDDSDVGGDDTDPFPVDDRSRLTSPGVQICADPGDRRDRGAYVRRTMALTPPPAQGRAGVAAAVGDLDGAGSLDVVLADRTGVYVHADAVDHPDGALTLLHPLAFTADHDGPVGVLTADLDADGQEELLVTGPGLGVLALRREGDAWVDTTEAWDLAGLDGVGGATQLDVDGDGALDLFLAGLAPVDRPDAPSPSWLLRWDGAAFVPGPPLPPIATDGAVLQAAAVVVDGGPATLLVRTAAPGLAVLRHEAGEVVQVDGLVPALDAARGAAIADLDGDGDDDVVVTTPGAVTVLRATAGAWAQDPNPPAPAAAQTEPWGPRLADLDNDGRHDVFVPFGWWQDAPDQPRLQPDALFAPRDDGGWIDRAAAQAVDDTAPNRQVLVADLNGDGWPDLVRPGLDGVVRYDLSRCGEAAWLEVRLRQPAGNPHAIGAEVSVTAGGQTWSARVRSGGASHASSATPTLTFGLGDADVVDELRVTWPDGLVERWTSLAARQALTLTRR